MYLNIAVIFWLLTEINNSCISKKIGSENIIYFVVQSFNCIVLRLNNSTKNANIKSMNLIIPVIPKDPNSSLWKNNLETISVKNIIARK